MAKFRVRVSHKGRRWKKGQSSSSNPSSSKFRNAAKSGFFQELPGESNLTKEAVVKHDAFMGEKVEGEMEEEVDIESLGGKTFKTFDTFATDWSSCSNKSFSKLLHNFRADSEVQKEMLAVLAAIAEVIKEHGGKETSTEYFAALMTALESGDNSDSSIHAIMSLLSMGIKSVPQPVLQIKFAEASKTYMTLLAKFSQTEKVAIIRPILGCVSVLLRAQEAAVWNESSTLSVLDSILAFITFSKPKVRKAAQHAITVIVRTSKITSNGVAHIGRYCTKLVESIAVGGVTTTLHTLTLLKEIAHMFPKKELKECSEAILKVMTMNNVLLLSCGMEALHGLLINRPSQSSLPPQRNARLITALFDYQPPPTDTQPTQAWLALMQQGYINLSKSDLNLCLINLPKFFSTATELYQTEKAETLSAVTYCLEALINECIALAAKPSTVAAHSKEISKIVSILQSKLGYQYHSAWAHVLHLMTSLFKACGVTCEKSMLPILKILAGLRDSYQFAYITELENAVGSAIRSMGPKSVLEAVPFKVTGNDSKKDFERSWLLPVLKDNIKASTLKFFIDYFVPLAMICRNKSDYLKKQNDQVGALSYDLMQSQIWALLPSFSSEPSDITASFPGIAKALGGVLTSRKNLRMTVLASLRRLVNYSIEHEKEEDKATMAKYAKNYLPLFFNIYTTKAKGSDEEGVRLAVLETIKVYLKVCSSELCAELFGKAYEKVKNSDDKFMRESVMDLLKCLIPYQNENDIEKLFEIINSHICSTNDHTLQKKNYRLLEELFSTDSTSCKQFISNNLLKVKDLLLNSLSRAAPSSKGARLRCLLLLLQTCEDPRLIVEDIIPEAVLCVKDVNSKCRDTAYNLLKTLADKLEPEKYVEMVMAGLAGNQSLMSSTLLSLAAIIHHYKDSLKEPIQEKINHNVGVLALCASREVVGTALSYVKVYIQTFSRDKVARYVPKILKIFSQMNNDCKRHCRTKVRDILARFIRWYGAETIYQLSSVKDEILRVRIKNLGKIYDRRKKLKEQEKQLKKEAPSNGVFTIKGKPKSIEEILAESDSDIDFLEEEDEKLEKKAKGKAWISEDADDIIDFTDMSTTKKIFASNPGVGKKQSVTKKSNPKSEFKKTPDGRLIIADSSDSENEGGKKIKLVVPGLESDSDDYQPSETDEHPEDAPTQGRKRKMSISTTASAVPSKYQAGGSGIHRPLRKVIEKKKKKGGPKPNLGEVYKTKKAGGDMKRKGLPDPYAYLPLRRDALNKRKKMKSISQFQNLIKSAKRGVKIGLKSKSRKKK